MVIELLEPNLTPKCVRNSVGIQREGGEHENESPSIKNPAMIFRGIKFKFHIFHVKMLRKED